MPKGFIIKVTATVVTGTDKDDLKDAIVTKLNALQTQGKLDGPASVDITEVPLEPETTTIGGT